MHCPACGATSVAGRRFCDQCGSPMPAAADTTALTPIGAGALIGSYQVLSLLESAGAGNQYLAAGHDGRMVRLREAEPEALAAEAAALSAVTDPAVAVVLDRFTAGGREYLVTSRPADAVLLEQAGTFDTDGAIAVALRLCDLAALWHKAGYVYGDFSPRSIHYAPQTGGLFLPGALSAVRIGVGQAGDPMAEGAAPEVVAGAAPVPAADVYGIASTLYRLLAGTAQVALPSGRTGQLLPQLSSLRPDVAPDFSAALAQALSVRASERFQTPEAFAAALRDVARPFRLEAGACTDRGSVREKNQDCMFTAVAGAAGADRDRSAGGVFICCDGMGGEAGGEIASGLTVETVGGAMAAFLGARMAQQSAPDSEELTSALSAALNRANKLLRDRVREEPALFGMGTTISAMVVSGESAVIIHVGDSRCYSWEPGHSLRQVTHDQSVVGKMVAQGLITEAEASLRPDRNFLWQAVGTRELLEPELITLTLRPGQRLLLVSDGVHGFLGPDRLAEILARPISPAAAANLIVNTALGMGSDDNCSAVVVDVRGRTN